MIPREQSSRSPHHGGRVGLGQESIFRGAKELKEKGQGWSLLSAATSSSPKGGGWEWVCSSHRRGVKGVKSQSAVNLPEVRTTSPQMFPISALRQEMSSQTPHQTAKMLDIVKISDRVGEQKPNEGEIQTPLPRFFCIFQAQKPKSKCGLWEECPY